MELRAVECAHDVIGTQADLDLLALRVDDALRILQDQWKVETVHMIIIAPSSACVLLGQKLQARHHAKFVIYERKRDPQSQSRGSFVPTIAISGSKVELVGTNKEVSLG
ncbi:MAG: SAVED domain-containing protein [Betaproteobacteria bacterium]|nr:SAVED domain-containing protein [Betaproteobacteria bacterium]